MAKRVRNHNQTKISQTEWKSVGKSQQNENQPNQTKREKANDKERETYRNPTVREKWWWERDGGGTLKLGFNHSQPKRQDCERDSKESR